MKRYHSMKQVDEEGWQHQSIELQPLNPEYQAICISAEDAEDIRIVGEFVSVIRTSDGR